MCRNVSVFVKSTYLKGLSCIIHIELCKIVLATQRRMTDSPLEKLLRLRLSAASDPRSVDIRDLQTEWDSLVPKTTKGDRISPSDRPPAMVNN